MSEQMKAAYEPKTWEQKLGYLVEEAGEVLAAAGKTLRWGRLSVNPELPPQQQETNIDWLIRELADLERAIYYVRQAAIIPPAYGTGGRR
jgi:NTP pyrophosphatase (non-canonical NTP hydrolase)